MRVFQNDDLAPLKAFTSFGMSASKAEWTPQVKMKLADWLEEDVPDA